VKKAVKGGRGGRASHLPESRQEKRESAPRLRTGRGKEGRGWVTEGGLNLIEVPEDVQTESERGRRSKGERST